MPYPYAGYPYYPDYYIYNEDHPQKGNDEDTTPAATAYYPHT